MSNQTNTVVTNAPEGAEYMAALTGNFYRVVDGSIQVWKPSHEVWSDTSIYDFCYRDIGRKLAIFNDTLSDGVSPRFIKLADVQ